MNAPRIALAQLNPTVGDMAGNAAQILAAARATAAQGAGLMLTAELSLCGYFPQDLLLRPGFLAACDAALLQLAHDLHAATPQLQVLVGHPLQEGAALYNAVSCLHGGRVTQSWRKQKLPNYGVFDEARHFQLGSAQPPSLLEFAGIRFGVLICEDAWSPEPALACLAAGATGLLVLNASPYHLGKSEARIAQMRQLQTHCPLPLVYAHQVGGQDELLFDGCSFALNAQGEVLARAPAFACDTILIDISAIKAEKPAGAAPALIAWPGREEALWHALVLGLRDYVRKNGFSQVALGLSGGIDSALVAVLALDALGADQVRTVMMPSPYTADMSWQDAQALAERCGMTHDEIAIAPAFESLKTSLAPLFAGRAEDVTEENLQARIRGVLLMALSNKTGALILSCGNKSEYATGYCTLYGDMCGAFAPIKDVLKTQVFALAHWRNSHNPYATADAPIPTRIITRPPSAELRPGQVDQDSLPPYEVLDAMLEKLLEGNASSADLLAAGFASDQVKKVTHLLKISEYKRSQAAPGTRVSPRAFGRDWRLPISQRFGY